jgi:hypothetical protein
MLPRVIISQLTQEIAQHIDDEENDYQQQQDASRDC